MKNTLHTRNRLQANSHQPGFTLIEVLTVIAIITILMGAGAIGIGNMSAGKGVASAVATAESLFDEARTIALAKGCRARVLLDVNDPSNDNYLRRIVIAHERVNNDGTIQANDWVISSRGYIMPKGTFYSRTYSLSETGTPLNQEILTGVAQNYLGQYVYYEFNSEGIFQNPGASFIVGTGTRPPNSANPSTTKATSGDFGGFVIWKNGRTSMLRSPQQIDNFPNSDQPFNF